jgi:hypothetical protein
MLLPVYGTGMASRRLKVAVIINLLACFWPLAHTQVTSCPSALQVAMPYTQLACTSVLVRSGTRCPIMLWIKPVVSYGRQVIVQVKAFGE